jgi:membrane protease YdiL (CAAX protease family)
VATQLTPTDLDVEVRVPPPWPDRRVFVLLAVVVEGGLILLALILGWLLDTPPFESWRWSGYDAARALLWTLPLLGGVALIYLWPVGPLRLLRDCCENFLRPLLRPLQSADLLLFALLAGVGEEMFFRGVLQVWLTEQIGFWAALVLTSVLFGLTHPVSWTYAMAVALVGFYLGWLFHFTDNLLVVILIHGLYDWAVMIFLRSGPTPSLRTDGKAPE